MSTTTASGHLWLLLATVPAFAALALAMERHQQDVFGQALSARRSRWLRSLGWAMLAGALALAIHMQGVALGLVSWAGHLSLAAGLVYLGLVTLDRYRAARRPSKGSPRKAMPPGSTPPPATPRRECAGPDSAQGR